MMRKVVLGSLIVLATATQAAANGRPAGTSTINFKQGNDQEILAGMTFGAVVSHDGGATWYWICEAAVGYGGMYDPRYAYSPSGAVFATTFDGLKVMRNACTFDATPLAGKFVSTIALGPDHALYSAAAAPADAVTMDPGDSKIYKSTNDGVGFPPGPSPGQVNDWWQSLIVAPSNAQRVYLAGYRLAGGNVKTFLLFKSDDGGVSYNPLTQTGFVTAVNSAIEIAGVSPTNPNLVFARVTLENNNIGDAIYVSTTGGASGTWTRILGKPADIAFVVRANGDLVAGTKTEGSVVSHDNGTTWIPLVDPPHINCLYENAAGEVWACTQNFGSNQVLSDDAGIMKSTDLATWTKVLRYQDIQAPVACAAGTPQHDTCEVTMWCGLRMQFGITSTFGNCPSLVDGPPDAGIGPVSHSGSCQTGDSSSAPTALVIGAAVGMVLVRRRRRRA
jgi:MYXO-CTERM domain-containing protein